MGNIHILSESLRNQIAAGEVVERPASVLKELLENAVDAGASDITIELEEAGLKKIMVKDNGRGMIKDDLLLSVKRHATSKISKKEDLFHIQSLGFRGEALASIASVSHFYISSKTKEDISASKVEVVNGDERKIQDCSTQNGTQVLVEDLFMNIPARKKFLKTAATEFKHCVTTFEDIAFCQPQVSFHFSHNSKELFKLHSSSFEERLENLLSKDVFHKLIPVKYEQGFISIKGFVSKPGEIFKTRNNQKVFVNKRSIKDSTISAAIYDAFHSFLEKGSYPAYYLFIDINEDLVDVNVHPRKSEVRFLRGQDVFQSVKKALLHAFEKKHKEFQSHQPSQSATHQSEHSFPQGQEPISVYPESRSHLGARQSFASKSFSESSFSQKDMRLSQSQASFAPKQTLNFEDQGISEIDELHGYRIVGQASKKFLILEKGERVIFLDQHAVHERARYDELIKAYQNKTPQSQKLLLPELLHLSSSESLSLKEYLEDLISMGFELEEFNESDFQVIALPYGVDVHNIKETVLRVCEELSSKGESREQDKKMEKALTYLSCRGSIMFGDKLSYDEMKAVVKSWLNYAKGLTCPHGRPLGFEMSVKEMEKKVGR